LFAPVYLGAGYMTPFSTKKQKTFYVFGHTSYRSMKCLNTLHGSMNV